MLVLTRKIGETIVIGDDIEVTVVAVSGGQVRLGITAPKRRIILRKEQKKEVRRYDKNNRGAGE